MEATMYVYDVTHDDKTAVIEQHGHKDFVVNVFKNSVLVKTWKGKTLSGSYRWVWKHLGM